MDDQFYMKIALELAKVTKGQTSPNPAVGAVVVKNGRIIGMGAHLKAGEPHAEIYALNMAGSEAKDSTIYVTLEPCSHYGRTPPCVERIKKEQVKRVVIATLDPNPLVAGRGVEILRNAGIEVTVGILEEEGEKLNEIFFKYITKKSPFVTVKVASTFDGKTATKTGDSKWITSEKAREYVQELRHQHDAIMVGVGTVIKDNPELTARGRVAGLNPLRVIIDSKLRIPMDAKVIQDQKSPTIIFTTENVSEAKIEKLRSHSIEVYQTTGSEKVDLIEVLTYLAEKNITSILVEGGSTLIGSLFDLKKIDKYILFLSPKLVGGKDAYSIIAGEGIGEMSEAINLQNIEVRTFENDLCIIGYPQYNL